jgi:hypothetical protein
VLAVSCCAVTARLIRPAFSFRVLTTHERRNCMDKDIDYTTAAYLVDRAIEAQDFIAGLTWGAP